MRVAVVLAIPVPLVSYQLWVCFRLQFFTHSKVCVPCASLPIVVVLSEFSVSAVLGRSVDLQCVSRSCTCASRGLQSRLQQSRDCKSVQDFERVSGRPSGNSSGLAIVNNLNKHLNWSRVEGWLIA